MAIIDKYLSFVTESKERNVLLARMAALNISGQEPASTPTPSSPLAGPSSAVNPTSDTMTVLQSPDNTKPLSNIMMALRKLREGIYATERADDFAIQAYIFNIRLAVLVHHPESYQPAILHLLRFIAIKHPMTSLEIEECAGYLILDAACRRRQLGEAHAIRRDFKVKDKNIFMALHALAHDNWVLFRMIKRHVDQHKKRLLDYAEDDMRLHTLKCFGRTYLNVDLEYLEKVTGRTWDELKEKDGVGWELDGERVTIRRVGAK